MLVVLGKAPPGRPMPLPIRLTSFIFVHEKIGLLTISDFGLLGDIANIGICDEVVALLEDLLKEAGRDLPKHP